MAQGELMFSEPEDFSGQPEGAAKPRARATKSESVTKPAEVGGAAGGESGAKSAGKSAERVLTVTQLTRLIKLTLNQNLPDKVTIEGEISNFKRHSSGHLYFTIKDENAQLPVVMWRTDAARLKFSPADGLAVIATGRVDVFERDGRYQLYVDKLQPAGAGALELAYRQLAEKLRNEGLFEPQRKKPIPAFPQTIAIVTSATGAAIQDIQKTLHRRFPIVRKVLYPVSVQGEGAAKTIAEALTELNRRQRELAIDVIILARGGGSIEDLWSFNEEVVARAIYASKIPIITGVGHESDTTIADLVADCRAATPTAAAEMATPVLTDLQQQIEKYASQLTHQIRQRVEWAQSTVAALSQRPCVARPGDLVGRRRQRIDELEQRYRRQILESLRRAEQNLNRCTQTLRRIEPQRYIGDLRTGLLTYQHRLATAAVGRLAPSKMTVGNLADRLALAQRNLAERRRESLVHISHRLAGLDPRAILRRGYSITRLQSTGRIVTPQTPLSPGDLLHTELADDMMVPSQVTAATRKKDADHDTKFEK